MTLQKKENKNKPAKCIEIFNEFFTFQTKEEMPIWKSRGILKKIFILCFIGTFLILMYENIKLTEENPVSPEFAESEEHYNFTIPKCKYSKILKTKLFGKNYGP